MLVDFEIAWAKKANSLGLKTLYQSNHDLKIKMKSLAALAFVSTTNVKNVCIWNTIGHISRQRRRSKASFRLFF